MIISHVLPGRMGTDNGRMGTDNEPPYLVMTVNFNGFSCNRYTNYTLLIHRFSAKPHSSF